MSKNTSSFFSRMFNKETGVESTKTSIFANINMNPVSWFKKSDKSYIEEGYLQNVIVHRCVDEIANNLATLDWVLFDSNGEKIEDHELLDLIKRPNPIQGQAAFFQELQTFKQITGNTYIHATRPSENRPPLELHIFPAPKMKIIAGDMMMPLKYEYRPNNEKQQTFQFPVDQVTGKSDILHIKTVNPLDPFYGLSPLSAAAYSVDLFNAASEWNMRLLQNGARPGGGLFVKTSLTPEQREQLKTSFNDVYTGAANAGKQMVIEGDMDWKDMSLSPKDMDYLESRNVSARDIATAFRVPPLLLSIGGDNNTYANMQEARLSLWEDLLIPEADMLRDELNNWLVPMFGDNLYLDYDKDKISALGSRREKIWSIVNDATFLTDNEKRAAVGYEPLDEPVVPEVEQDVQDDTSKSETIYMVEIELKNDHIHEIDLTIKNGSTTMNADHAHSYTIGAKKTGITNGHSHNMPDIEWEND